MFETERENQNHKLNNGQACATWPVEYIGEDECQGGDDNGKTNGIDKGLFHRFCKTQRKNAGND